VTSERFVDPEVGQALEEVRDALRAERSSQEPLATENAELLARAERLQAEQEQLRGELEHLREGRPRHAPRLPEVLKAPFEVRPEVTLRRRLREALPLLMLLVLPVALSRKNKIIWAVLVVVASALFISQVLTHRRGRGQWRFTEDCLETQDPEVQGGLVLYRDMRSVEPYSSKGQRLRGVGSVGVKYRAVTGEEKLLTLKDVAEPDRLAEWLEAKRLGRA
jgi:hypothetical protein